MCLEDDCDDGRRTFLRGAGATLAGFAMMSRLDVQAQNQDPPPTRVLDDPKIQHGRVVFKHAGTDGIDGFLARPKAEGVYPAVMVVAGNRITEEYIPNTCAALAVAGFVGLAPNVFHPLPNDAPRNEYDKYLKSHTELDVRDDIQAAASYLRTQPFVSPGGMGIVGFCFGGRMAMLYAARSREIDAVVPFHPGVMKEGELKRLVVPVQIHHGTADGAVSVKEIQNVEKTLKAQKTPVELFTYEGADHGFLAYTRQFYKPEYAKLAWSRVTEFLHKNLK